MEKKYYKIAVIGTGMIGPDIALGAAIFGHEVVLIGRSDCSLDRGMKRLNSNLEALIRANVIRSEDRGRVLSLIKRTISLKEGVGNKDFVFEAISEDLIEKQQIFKRIEHFSSPKTIFASSTSGLSPNDISAEMSNSGKKRSLVTHFWNPPFLVPLVEIVSSETTGHLVLDVVRSYLIEIGKTPILLKKDALGHIGNRLQHALFREAINIVQEGIATPDAIDAVVINSLGPRYAKIGPMEYLDSTGIDLAFKIHEYLFPRLAADQGPQTLLKQMYSEGALGVKTGYGFYDWENDKNIEEMTLRQNSLFLETLKGKLNSNTW